jgi:hypothetical protein
MAIRFNWAVEIKLFLNVQVNILFLSLTRCLTFPFPSPLFIFFGNCSLFFRFRSLEPCSSFSIAYKLQLMDIDYLVTNENEIKYFSMYSVTNESKATHCIHVIQTVVSIIQLPFLNSRSKSFKSLCFSFAF